MHGTRINLLRVAQLLFLTALVGATPVFAQNRAETPDNRLPPQHFSPGTADGVHVRPDVPTYHHEVGRMVARPGPRDSYVATGRGVIISGPGRVHHGHYYRSPRVHTRYRTPARWVPGHWTWVSQRVWVPGRSDLRRVPAVYRREFHGGREILVLEQEERWERVWIPGRYETRRQRVWVDGYWARY